MLVCLRSARLNSGVRCSSLWQGAGRKVCSEVDQMAESERQNTPSVWKSVMFGFCLPIVVRILNVWLSEPLAWGLGTFIWTWLFYLIPPRTQLRMSFFKALLLSLAGAIAVYAFMALMAGV